MHLLPGTVSIVIGGIAFVIAPLLFAIAPVGANYWSYTLPSMICGTIGIDITFNVYCESKAKKLLVTDFNK